MAYYLEWSTRQCEHLLGMFSAWSLCKINKDEERAGFEDLSHINGPSSEHSPRCTIKRIEIRLHRALYHIWYFGKEKSFLFLSLNLNPHPLTCYAWMVNWQSWHFKYLWGNYVNVFLLSGTLLFYNSLCKSTSEL